MDVNDDINADRVAETAEERTVRLCDLVGLWEDYRTSTNPVTAAFALAEFANAMAHLRWRLEDDGALPPS
jgi:hypothetical protein